MDDRTPVALGILMLALAAAFGLAVGAVLWRQ